MRSQVNQEKLPQKYIAITEYTDNNDKQIIIDDRYWLKKNNNNNILCILSNSITDNTGHYGEMINELN